MADEFKVHRLNAKGLARATDMAAMFDDVVIALDLPQSRERSIVITKLQEACFFAKRAIAEMPENQE